MKSISTLFRQLFLIVVLISAFSLSALAAVYEKVTTAPSDWSGQYLIVYETDKVAFDGSRTTLDAVSNTKSITISNNQISVDTDNFYFTIAKSGSNYTIKSASGYYIGQTSDTNGLKSNTSTTYSNTLTINNDQSINFVSGGAYLRYNAASDQNRFRYYKSGSYTGQKAIQLYKLVENQSGDNPEEPLTLTANINGITQEVGSFAEGTDITAALETIDVTAPEGWSFAGWVANAIDGSQTTTPEYLTTMPAEATIAYAVFKLGKEQIFTETLSASTANYTGNNGYCEFTATSTSGTWKGKANYVKDKKYIQINAEKGYILSTNFAGNVNSIKITTTNTTRTDRTFYINSDSITGKPTSGDLGSHKTTTVDEEFTINLTSEAKQFYIYSSGAVYISKIEVTYGTASNVSYRTSVSSLVVTNDDTETISDDINSLTLYVDKTPNTQLEITETITADKVTIIQTIDSTRWFFFSLPFDCQIDDIVAIAANDNSLTYDTHYVISKYNPTRAEGQNNAWEDLHKTDKLNANQGYIIGHWYERSDNIIVKFPSTDAQTISAPEDKTLNYTDTWFVDGENSSKGFNLIGMPYYQNINSTISCGDVYIYSTTPNTDGKTYTQKEYTGNNVAPFTSFFVQVAENTAPKFTISTKSSSAPMLRAKDVVAKATITLADANGGTDATTVINNPTKTTDYEIGHDLVKWIGYASIPQIYSLQGDEMLAFNSLAIDNSTVIPLGVYAHADGEYTFALSEKSVGDLQGWELYDNETGSTTRLANEDLTIYLEQGTHEGRFEIRLQQRVTTNCDNSMGNMMTWTANGTLNINNMPTDAVVYIYDAVGRMIYVATPNATTFNYTFAARGVYNIVVRSADNTISFKTIY